MIDYDKLRFAHELCQKLNGPYYADFIMSGYHCEYTISDSEGHLENNPFFITESLDEFIDKLKELVASDSKYKTGDEVWGGYKNPLRFTIFKVLGDSEYQVEDNKKIWQTSWNESELYPTKKDLICAQIQYWQSMMSECILDEK